MPTTYLSQTVSEEGVAETLLDNLVIYNTGIFSASAGTLAFDFLKSKLTRS